MLVRRPSLMFPRGVDPIRTRGRRSPMANHCHNLAHADAGMTLHLMYS